MCYNEISMSDLEFDGQRDGEEVIFVFRRHIMTARKGLLFCLMMIGIGVLPMVMWPGDSRMFWIFTGFVVLGMIGMLYTHMLWYFSYYIVTNQRIRQVVQRGIFKKTVVDLGLDKIQSISMSVPGVIAGIFGYGTILIQTGVGDLVISMVSHPEEIHNKLQNAKKENKR